jgi:ABC-type Zn uptake system ZnuABC Zn-binding protein ZnuA
MGIREIESAIEELSPQQLVEFRAWFEDYCEDNLELTDEVKAKLEQAREDVAAGRYRTRQP